MTHSTYGDGEAPAVAGDSQVFLFGYLNYPHYVKARQGSFFSLAATCSSVCSFAFRPQLYCLSEGNDTAVFKRFYVSSCSLVVFTYRKTEKAIGLFKSFTHSALHKIRLSISRLYYIYFSTAKICFFFITAKLFSPFFILAILRHKKKPPPTIQTGGGAFFRICPTGTTVPMSPWQNE